MAVVAVEELDHSIDNLAAFAVADVEMQKNIPVDLAIVLDKQEVLVLLEIPEDFVRDADLGQNILEVDILDLSGDKPGL